jgi:hypothetical protein
MKVRPDVSTSLAADFADEPRLDIRKSHVIGPLVRADRDRMAALIIRAVDQDPAHVSVAHLSEGYFLRASKGGHAPLKRDKIGYANQWTGDTRGPIFQ